MVMDIRDYLPPSLKHVMVYMNPAEREKRQQAARDAFGQPTPAPPASKPGTSAGPEDTDDATLKVQPASPWSAGAKGGVDKEMLPSALVPPVTVSAKPARARRATVHVIPVRVVITTALIGLVLGGIVIAWKWQEPRRQGASPSPPATATPSVAVMPSATEPVLGVVPPAATSSSAAPSVTATVAPSAPTTSTRTTPVAPRGKSTTDPTDPYDDAPHAAPKGRRPRGVDAGAPSSDEPVITE